MLNFTMTQIPVFGSSTFTIHVEDDDIEAFEREVYIDSDELVFERIDLFLHDIAKKKHAELYLGCEDKECHFECFIFPNTWTVRLRLDFDKNKDVEILITTHNLFCEFGKILAIRNWLDDSYYNDEIAEKLNNEWKVSLTKNY